jgi:hypothetical protein
VCSFETAHHKAKTIIPSAKFHHCGLVPQAGITEANSTFNMWSDARYPAAAPTLTDFLNWMPSTSFFVHRRPKDGVEDIQESAEAALAATSQGI